MTAPVFNLSTTALARLRSLFDMRVIRATLNSPAFSQLVSLSLATRRWTKDDPSGENIHKPGAKIDFVITPYGELVARRTFRQVQP